MQNVHGKMRDENCGQVLLTLYSPCVASAAMTTQRGDEFTLEVPIGITV